MERRRLDFWLSSALVESVEDGRVDGLLRMCVEFVEMTKECPNCVDGFLRMYLKTWNGNANRQSVFHLLLCLIPSDLESISPVKK